MKDLSVARTEITNFIESFNNILDHIGLVADDRQIKVFDEMKTSADTFFNVVVQLRFKTEFDPSSSSSSKNPYFTKFSNLLEGLRNSKMIETRVKMKTSELEEELRTATKMAEVLLDKVKELEKYKLHYDVEMKLRHGETNGTPKVSR